MSDNSPEVVFKRPSVGSGEPTSDEYAQPRLGEIAPAITPLIIGFLLLLALISMLGWWSVLQMDSVSSYAHDLEIQHSARLSLLLNLRLAITKLDNEARARQQAEARRELGPLIDVRLGNAREEVKELLPILDRPPLADEPSWRQMRNESPVLHRSYGRFAALQS